MDSRNTQSAMIWISAEGATAVVRSSKISGIQISCLSLKVTTVVFQQMPEDLKVFQSIPKSVLNLCLPLVTPTLKLNLDLLPRHLEVFWGGKRVRSGERLYTELKTTIAPFFFKGEKRKREKEKQHSTIKCAKSEAEGDDGQNRMII